MEAIAVVHMVIIGRGEIVKVLFSFYFIFIFFLFYFFTYFEWIWIDFDECQGENGGNDCDYHATCTNGPGNYTCKCKEGFEGDGKSCEGSLTLKIENSI